MQVNRSETLLLTYKAYLTDEKWRNGMEHLSPPIACREQLPAEKPKVNDKKVVGE